MNIAEHPSLADLVRLVVGAQILGLRNGMPIKETPGGPPSIPQFEDKVWFQNIKGNKLLPVPPALLDELTENGLKKAVFVDTFISADPQTKRRLRIKKGNAVYQDSGAVIHHVLEEILPGTTVAFLAPASVTSLRSFECLRADIDKDNGIEWIIYADGHLLPQFHPGFQVVILVLKVGAGPSKITRLIDLRRIDSSLWLREIRSAKKRGGGEVGRSIVLRETRMGWDAWTYERWTKEFSDSKTDARELGNLRPLGELVESIVAGLDFSKEISILKTLNEGGDSTGLIPVVEGRDIKPEGLTISKRYRVQVDDVPAKLKIAEGDLLLLQLISMGPSGPKVRGAVAPAGIEAVIGPNVLRLRWKQEIPNQTRDLLTAWILSERASKSLAALGFTMNRIIHTSALLELEVPDPSKNVLDALGSLEKLEHWYRNRAESVWKARQTIFSEERYGEVVPLLLKTQQDEGERVAAAEDSQKFEYRVRNYFPHPIALRRERLQVLEHGKPRLEETLDCAEYLVHFLALCGLVQLGTLRPENSPLSRQLKSTLNGGTLKFSWGNSWAVLKEAVDATKQLEDPLVTPIPQFSLLAEIFVRLDSGPGKAEAELRLQRNSQSHLHRVPEPELVEISKRLGQSLDELLQAVSFLADIPLVYVRDYALEWVTGKRKARFDLLRGASVVFEQNEQVVDREIPREDLGLLSREGEFFSFRPWLLLRNCQICKRPEIFLFNRFDGRQVSFVAMETGHTWESEKLRDPFLELLQSS